VVARSKRGRRSMRSTIIIRWKILPELALIVYDL
jgi:hypothetical protein